MRLARIHIIAFAYGVDKVFGISSDPMRLTLIIAKTISKWFIKTLVPSLLTMLTRL